MVFAARTLHPLLAGMLDFVYPPLCAGCGRFDDSGTGICETCRRLIDTLDQAICLRCEAALGTEAKCPFCPEGGLPLFAYGIYRTPLREIIIQFKFRDVVPPIESLVSGLAHRFSDQIEGLRVDCLVPIPLHPHREHRRGYNQARVIADSFSDHTGLAVAEDLVVRIKGRKPQAKLDFVRRKENIKGVFAAEKASGAGQRILLVDDVVTSGATVMEVTKVLETAGHRVVGVVALAHGA